MLEDLKWLGLVGTARCGASRTLRDLRQGLDQLAARGLIYPCFWQPR